MSEKFIVELKDPKTKRKWIVRAVKHKLKEGELK